MFDNAPHKNEEYISVGLQMIARSVEDQSERRMIERWRKEYEIYNARRSRRRQILEAISGGYDTLSEIVAHTGIPWSTVRRTVLSLVGKKEVRRESVKNTTSRNGYTSDRFEIAES